MIPFLSLLLSAVSVLLLENACRASSLPLDKIKLPPGFEITVYADHVPNARAMTLGRNHTFFVGTRRKGDVYAVVDQNGDQRADQVLTIARGLHMPAGVAYLDGSLYVSAVDRILRFDDIEQRLTDPPDPVVVTDHFPQETSHGWKFIAFGPDKKLYVPVGAPCNICEPDPDRYALIGRLNPDGTGYEIVARGVRNSVGFDWDPITHELWFTDNGRDWLGDDKPPDELNHDPSAGLHFGYPYCHGGRFPTLNTAANAGALNLRRQRSISTHMSRHWACGFIQEPCSLRNIEIRSSLPSTDHGTGPRRSAIASRSYRATAKEAYDTRYSPKDGCKDRRHGEGL